LSTGLQMTDQRWRSLSKGVIASLLNLLFPPVCSGCKQVGALFCAECTAAVDWLAEPLCLACGRPTPASVGQCDQCRQRPLSVQPIRAAAGYSGPLIPLIHQMKYNGFFSLAEPLADLMATAWPTWQRPVELVVPIPLHPRHERERGYNQSALLARHLCGRFGWTLAEAALRRVKETQQQARLGAAERQANVQGAFVADAGRVAGRQVLLIDDVCTTGATLTAAADALWEAGATAVSAYCATRAVGNVDNYL
jgi:ComF family protein